MHTTEIGAIKTRSEQLTNHLRRLPEYSCYSCILIQGEHGSGRRLFAQELAQQMSVHSFVRYQAREFSKEVQQSLRSQLPHKNACVLIEEIESLAAQDQQLLYQMIEELPDIKWILISAHDIRNLANKGLILKNLCLQIEVEISIAPLRDRPEDCEIISETVLETLAWMTGKIKKLDISALRKIKEYSWPGNVAELERVLERAFLQTELSVISAQDLDIQESSMHRMQLTTLNEMERKLILQTLQVTQNNKSQAARILGISNRTLRNKLVTYRQEGFYESNV